MIFIRRRPSKATTYFRCRFFSSSIRRSKRRDNTPHTFHPGCLSSSIPLPPSMPNFGWLLCPPIKRRPSKAKGPPISLFFSSINIPPQTTGNRPPQTFRPGLASSPTHPLAHGVGERRRHDLVAPLLYPWRERGQSRWRVEGGTAHLVGCCVCVCCVLCFVLQPTTRRLGLAGKLNF